MDRDWILLARETRRAFAGATWIPLRANTSFKNDIEVTTAGYVGKVFACGSVAFPPAQKAFAETLGWSEIGIGHNAQPYAYTDGHYSPIDEFQYHDRQPIGIELVFEHPQPVVGGKLWILNPDLVVALRLIKEGSNWVRPEEDFVVVAREEFDADGSHSLIEIKREFLKDYLAARNLSLRLSYYRQHVENVTALDPGPYSGLESHEEVRDGGRFELLVRNLDDVYGGSWALFRAWRTDVDEDDDAPVLPPETDGNTDFEASQGHRGGYAGVRVEGEFWREEWIEHDSRSVRVRGDTESDLPNFIVETDGSRSPSAALNDEDVGRWLWFRSAVVNELLAHRGFSLEWYTRDTGGICSTSGYRTHFGINAADLITVYAYDVARLPAWEQRIWAAHNVAPDGKVSSELLLAQVKADPADTEAPETGLIRTMKLLERDFRARYGITLFSHAVDDATVIDRISRFASKDRATLLRLAKELIRVFSDRINVKELRGLSTHVDRDKLGSNKLLQDILAQSVGTDEARRVLGPLVGAYDMRVGDAHPTSSSIGEAIALAGIDENLTYVRQGEQLIENFVRAIWTMGWHLFANQSGDDA